MQYATPDETLLDSPRRELLRAVTGIEPDWSGRYVDLKWEHHSTRPAFRSTRRLGLGEIGGGVVVATWPGELVSEAFHLYSVRRKGRRALRLLEAAAAGGWEVNLRPHLAFWQAPAPGDALYMTPERWLTAEAYVRRWSGSDFLKIGGHPVDAVRGELWPWLLERGYATAPDGELMEPFMERVVARDRPDVHLRPALSLVRRWPHCEVRELEERGQLAARIRAAVDELFSAVGDSALPAKS